MENYPYFVYEIGDGLLVTKLIHFIPEGEEKPKGGVTVTCRESPFEEDGEIKDVVRELIQRYACKVRRDTGMPVCVVYAHDDCDYIGPELEVTRSSHPPVLGKNLLHSRPVLDEQSSIAENTGNPLNLAAMVKKPKATIH